MIITRWGVLYETFPLSGGVKGGLCLDFQKTSSVRRSFRAFFFSGPMQLEPTGALAAGCSFYTHG